MKEIKKCIFWILYGTGFAIFDMIQLLKGIENKYTIGICLIFFMLLTAFWIARLVVELNKGE